MTHKKQTPEYEPTEEEIERGCEEVRARRTPQVLRRLAKEQKKPDWTPPEIALGEWGVIE